MDTLPKNLLELSIAERIQLVQDLWDSIPPINDTIPLTEAQKEELERRLASYCQNPTSGSSWEEVKQRIIKPL